MLIAEGAEYHRERMRMAPDRFGADVRDFLYGAQLLPASAYVRALRVQRLIQDEIMSALESVDILAMPTMPCTAQPVGSSSFDAVDLGGISVSLAEAHIRNTAPFNLAGLPAGSQPCGFDGDGLPVGLQVAGRPGDEESVLQVMHAFERVTDWNERLSPAALHPGPDRHPYRPG